MDTSVNVSTWGLGLVGVFQKSAILLGVYPMDVMVAMKKDVAWETAMATTVQMAIGPFVPRKIQESPCFSRP